jgi:hypothetical protein
LRATRPSPTVIRTRVGIRVDAPSMKESASSRE